jgi:hypothetical protein
MVMDVSMNVIDPATGEIKPDPLTGEPLQKQSEFGPRIFWDEKEFENWKLKIANGPAFTAIAMQKITAQNAIDTELKLKAELAKTPEGVAFLAGLKAKTGKDIALTGQAERSPAGTVDDNKVKSKMENLDGTETIMSTPEMNQRKDNAKHSQEKLPGVTAQELRFIEQGRHLYPGVIENLAQKIVNDGSDQADIQAGVEEIQKRFKVSPGTAQEILRNTMRGREKNKPGLVASFINSLFGSNKEVPNQTLAEEARDFD